MAHVPVTARQKFKEAAYFYNGMLANRLNVTVIPYYLSAFVSAFPGHTKATSCPETGTQAAHKCG